MVGPFGFSLANLAGGQAHVVKPLRGTDFFVYPLKRQLHDATTREPLQVRQTGQTMALPCKTSNDVKSQHSDAFLLLGSQSSILFVIDFLDL